MLCSTWAVWFVIPQIMNRHESGEQRGRVHVAHYGQPGPVGTVCRAESRPRKQGRRPNRSDTCSRLPAETAAAMRGVVAVARKLNTTKLKENSAVLTPSAPCREVTAAELSFMLDPMPRARMRY